jgi:hypothetical protein
MKQQIRLKVFETNSSTQHTLTIQRQVDSSGNLSLAIGRIPSDTVFKFTNSRVENIEDGCAEWKDENDIVSFATEIDKLALCVAFCRNSYEAMLHKETNQWYWDYMEEANCDENGNYDINAVAKDKPFFKELYQAIKEVRNTDLVLTDAIYELDSLNDDTAFEGLINSYRENIDSDYVDENLVTFFKDIIFGDYTIFDELFPC